MAIKRLLSDTDSQRGHDTRFATAVVIGKVSKIECTDKHANVRVLLPDRVDHNGTPLNTKPIPVLQVASQAKKSYAVPRINDQVVLIKLANGTSDYLCVGSFYTSSNKPPVSDPMLDFVQYDDGSTMQFNASTGELTWKLKGNMLWDNKGDFTFKTQGDIDIEIDGDITAKPQGNIDVEAGGDVDLKASGDTVIQAANITLRAANITLDGFVHTTANMQTDGVHTDSHGLHSSGARAGTQAVTANTETWQWTMSLTDAAGAGQAGLDAVAWVDAREVHLSMMTADDRDVTALLEAVTIGHELLLQAQADSTKFGRYTVIGESKATGGWWTFPVRLVESNATPPTKKNTLVTVTLLQPTDVMAKMAALEQRIAQLEART